MSTTRNPLAGRYFTDQSFASAVSNLASAFAPPSPEEYLLAEQVRSERDKNARLSELWQSAGGDFDRMGIAANLYDPTQSYYAVDTNAATSRANNAADNARALEQTRLNGAFDRVNTPLTYEQALPGIDPAFAEALGLPATGPVTGVGLGAPAPALSENQVEGQLLLDAIQGGNLTPADAATRYRSDIPTTNIVTPEGPRIVNTVDAVGKEPYMNKGATAAPDLLNYITTDGKQGVAIADPTTGGLIDANTRQPIANVTRVFKLNAQDGNAAGAGLTTSNNTAGNNIIADAQYGLSRSAEFRNLLLQNPGVLGIPGRIRGFAQDVVAGIDELGQAYGITDGNFRSLDEVRAVAEAAGASGGYDPALAQAMAYALEMAYLQAKMQDPGGEVNVREMERLLSTYDGGIAGNAKVLANLDVLDQQLKTRIAQGQQLTGQGQILAPSPPVGQPAQQPTPSGSLIPFSLPGFGAGSPSPAPAPQQPATGRPRAVNPTTGEAVEFDGQQWVPAP